MTATVHRLPREQWRNRMATLENHVAKSKWFVRTAHEYAKLNGDKLLEQMAREFLEGMER